ncbi:uncharacterized protein OCT59_004621 [Rhizophagus irregularis]|uniref:Restriction endonuclease type IV Mrr domain-containing protein n=5 Tax=Rhizophagus irregularis TaxID=588596 RepID=A0A915Z5W3_9GLOM|nr:hypothetical protein GLOIN_2v1536491 [Rhizophagus irregularis DAOM 181602=DAOM 197198]EXX55803.1 hypothetical protein RirG_222100 [Rhizophagus irregularis DAOM 197198w]UZO13116.1 hypothetical protein OCT59_004621 [Rhizophagus irregularis]POG78687.1 hypothetical protein GLOIN_2v1536491 [Rhizophagus irregularis DAOM 181602=DAOM 197198]CAB5363063.1 unnamed protein product [Rhizophagus irregularis]CAG8450081.1 7424_t:CDS:2 [Rhizophagus irregularis]|eukprot:XP_025185553.1 hypothetical protein GLOIN_2v1536491 [Rhizophagus irregularis DAOM 181602=DAOM 197198]
MTKISDYFLNTPANDYKFLGYYNYRRQQPDFTFSFEKEACNLSVELEKLIKGNYSREIKTAANRLLNNHKDHRRRHCDVQVFWDQIESSGSSINTSDAQESEKIQTSKVYTKKTNDNLIKSKRKRPTESFTPHLHPVNNERITKPFRSGNFKPEVNLSTKGKLKLDLDYPGGSFSSFSSFSSEDDCVLDNEMVKFVRDGLETLGMRATMTRTSYNNPITKEKEFFDNYGVDIFAWYKEMEVLIQCRSSVTTKTIQEMESLLLNQNGKIGCIVSDCEYNKDIINLVNACKRKIILTTKSKAYFDIEEHYNIVKMSRRQAPLVHRNIVMEDVKIEVVKGSDDEIKVMDQGVITVKGKGNTKICISCKRVVQSSQSQ